MANNTIVLNTKTNYNLTFANELGERTHEIEVMYNTFADKGMIYEARATNGNKKLGRQIFNINLPPVVTCNPKAPCFKGCYARKGHFLYSNVTKRQNENLFAFVQNPDKFFNDIAEQTKLSLYVRWFGSGDMPNMRFFEGMVKVARKNPNVKYLAFTKQYPIVNAYLDSGKKIPSNLKVVFSSWMEWIPENPHNLPTTWVKFDIAKKCEEEFVRFNANIPEKAFACPNGCANCLKCWQLKKGESVVFKKH